MILLVYVSDEIVAAIPTLKNHQFTLSTLDDDYIDTEKVMYLPLNSFWILLVKKKTLQLFLMMN